MKALILAAGQGSRIRTHMAEPKCLLELGGETLLAHMLRGIMSWGLKPRIVVGYKQEVIREHVRNLGLQGHVEFVYNPDFHLGSVGSLYLGLGEMKEKALVIDADVYFHPDLVGRLVLSPHDSCLLIDTAFGFTDEEYTAGIRGDRVMELKRGQAEGFSRSGVWVGLTKLGVPEVVDFRNMLKRLIDEGNGSMGYEDAMSALLLRYHVGYELADDLPWTEIDFPWDYEEAQKLVAEIQITEAEVCA